MSFMAIIDKGERFHYFASQFDHLPNPHCFIRMIGHAYPHRAGWYKAAEPIEDYRFLVFHQDILYSLANGDHRCPAHGLIILPPHHCLHRYGNLDTDWQLSWINWQGSEIESLLTASDLPHSQAINLRSPQIWEQCVAGLRRELCFQQAPDERILVAQIGTFVHEAQRAWNNDSVNDEHAPIAQYARQYIERNCTRSLSLDELAAQFGRSPRHLSRIFEERWKCTPFTYHRTVRMEQARLMIEQELSNERIATELGYTDGYAFSKAFKKHHGHSPRHYRNQFRHD